MPNILETIFLSFTEIIINMINQKGNDITKMMTVKAKLIDMFANIFSRDEENNEGYMSQDGKDTEAEKEETRGRSRIRNPRAGRQRPTSKSVEKGRRWEKRR